MKKNALYYGVLAAGCTSLLTPGAYTLRAADSQEAAQSSAASRLPINLARGSLGASLMVKEPSSNKNKERSGIAENDSAQALISDDAALTYPLQEGKTSVIIALPRIQVLSKLNFVNFGAAGTYNVSVSSAKQGFDGTGWRSVASGASFDGSAIASSDLGSADARYVKIDFTAERAGRISGLGVFGMPTIGAYQAKPLGYSFASMAPGQPASATASARNVYFDMADLSTGAKVVALSRGSVEQAQAMIDGNVESSFSFDPADPAPAAVVDLGVRRSLSRLSCVYDAPPGRLDFYVVDNPYPNRDKGVALNYVGSPSVEVESNATGEYSGRSSTHGRQAIYSVDTSLNPGLNRLAADLSGQSGRFLVAEFHPVVAATSAPMKDDSKDTPDFKDTGSKDVPSAAAPLRILSLSAFGQNPSTEVVPELPSPGSGTTTTTPSNPPPPVFPPGQGGQVVSP
jgi:hypothetical protein